jgi:NADPH:quinone reductase-like Zn-dependent oxidoreductase
VVDDEKDSRDIIARLLTKAGATVRTAGSGDEGLREVEAVLPDILVSDIGMPRKDGYAFIRDVRALPTPARSLPAIALTALQGVDNALRIAAGESVIVHGASGNVGMMALQFAKMRGARVLATASGADGVELVRRLGADHAVDGKRDDITEAARRFAPDGIDAVLAFVGGEELTRCLDAVRDGGRLAYPNGIEPEPRKRKGLKITSYDAENEPRHFEQLNRAMAEGRIEIPIAEVFGLDDARRAHERLARGHILGKIVLDIRR